MLASISMLLSACGGGGDIPLDEVTAHPTAHASTAVQRSQGYNGPATTPGLAARDEFKDGFNPSIWNNHRWYECNCERNQGASAPSAALPAFSR